MRRVEWGRTFCLSWRKASWGLAEAGWGHLLRIRIRTGDNKRSIFQHNHRQPTQLPTFWKPFHSINHRIQSFIAMRILGADHHLLILIWVDLLHGEKQPEPSTASHVLHPLERSTVESEGQSTENSESCVTLIASGERGAVYEVRLRGRSHWLSDEIR